MPILEKNGGFTRTCRRLPRRRLQGRHKRVLATRKLLFSVASQPQWNEGSDRGESDTEGSGQGNGICKMSGNGFLFPLLAAALTDPLRRQRGFVALHPPRAALQHNEPIRCTRPGDLVTFPSRCRTGTCDPAAAPASGARVSIRCRGLPNAAGHIGASRPCYLRCSFFPRQNVEQLFRLESVFSVLGISAVRNGFGSHTVLVASLMGVSTAGYL